MIQDWGYKYVYLSQPHAPTRIDFWEHFHKNVIKTLMRDKVSTMGWEDIVPSWLVHNELLWLCKMNDKEEGSKAMVSIEYVCEFFLENLFEPYV